MLESDLFELMEGTVDPAFGVTTEGVIVLWNSAAEEFFGIPAASAVGSRCHELICGRDPSERVYCRPECPVLQRASAGQSTPAFDLQVKTVSGYRWVNISTLIASLRTRTMVLYLARDVHHRKQIEQITRAFLGGIGAISGLKIEEMLSTPPMPHIDLTANETAVLRLLVEGKSTTEIGETLHVSKATVRNHIEHVLHKLSAHSRMEAVLRAIREKLV
jgi:PAS domain S-box-containing protein